MIEIGTSIGRYHILEQLGRGGMATVYKAYDTRLEREVAIKVIRRNAFSPDILERVLKRFDREAKSLARLTHPNIVSIIDYGEYENSPYLVMPYLPGGTVKQFLGKPINYEKVVELLLPIADALRYSHQKGIVHRDVKPANILITEGGQPMLTDFGIARLLENEDAQTLTGTGVGVGTPEYMSPEQGIGKEVDGRSDIYSLGVVLYELVTGHKPYTADTPMAIVLKQATESLPSPRKFVPELPEKVERVLFKALAKKPEDRYPDMATFAAALESLARSADQPTTGSGGGEEKPDNTVEGSDRGKANPPEETEEETPETVDDLTIPPGKKAIPRFWKVAAIVAAVIGLSIWGIGRLPSRPEATPAITAAPTQITDQPTAPATVTPTPLQPTEILPTPTSIPTMDFAKLDFTETGTIGTINEVVYSPDGNHFAVATSWGVYIFESATAREVMKLDIGAYVMSVAYSPNGQILATGATDKTIKLWNANTGEFLRRLEGHGHNSAVGVVNFSPDGRFLVSESNMVSILWDITTGNPIQSVMDCDIVFSPQGGSFVIHRLSKDTIEIWDTKNDGIQLRRTIQEEINRDVAFINESTLVWSSQDGIRILDTDSGAIRSAFENNYSYAHLIVSPDMKILTVLGWTGNGYKIDFWNIKNMVLVTSIFSDSYPTYALSPDGHTFAFGYYHREEIYFYSVDTGEQIHSLNGYSQGVRMIAFSPDGLSLITVTDYDRIRIWGSQDH